MDRLESMRVLITAVEAGSLSAAGRRLGTPLATVSRKVSELESHLRTRLLTRTRRGLTWTFRIRNADASVAIRSRLIVNTAEAAIDAAIAGLGITRVLSYQVAAAIRLGALAIALPEFEPPPWPVNLVFAGQRLLPLKLRAFLDFAAPRLRERLSEHAARKPGGWRGVDFA